MGNHEMDPKGGVSFRCFGLIDDQKWPWGYKDNHPDSSSVIYRPHPLSSYIGHIIPSFLIPPPLKLSRYDRCVNHFFATYTFPKMEV